MKRSKNDSELQAAVMEQPIKAEPSEETFPRGWHGYVPGFGAVLGVANLGDGTIAVRRLFGDRGKLNGSVAEEIETVAVKRLDRAMWFPTFEGLAGWPSFGERARQEASETFSQLVAHFRSLAEGVRDVDAMVRIFEAMVLSSINACRPPRKACALLR